MIVKTDWKAAYSITGEYQGDYFNCSDYERIKSNLKELHTLSLCMYKTYSLEEMQEKLHKDYFYAEDINALENNLENIVQATYPFSIGDKKYYQAQDPFLTFHELNRMEAGILYIYEQLLGQQKGTPRLQFTCGGGNITC